MKKLKIFLLLLTVTLFITTSCKKDEPEPEVTYKSPTAAGRTTVVDIPAKLQALADSNDPNATVAVTYMSLANAISSFASSFTVPPNATEVNKKSTSKVYTWSYQGYSYWMTFSVEADKYTWTYEYQTPDIPRFTFISAWELKTEKQGSWTIYDPQATSTSLWTYNWSLNASNDFTANLAWNDGGESSTFDITSKADHSGSFFYYINLEKEAEIHWAADGSGTYWRRGYPDPVTGSWQ